MELKEGYKMTEVGVIPEDWKVYSLGEIFGFKNGLNKGKEYFGSGTPIVNYMDVYHKRGIRNKDIKGKVSLSNQELKIYDVRKGDVFFTRTSETVEEIGLSAVILEDVESTVFSGFILRARPLKPLLDLEFCQYCFSTMIVRKAITSKSSYTCQLPTKSTKLYLRVIDQEVH